MNRLINVIVFLAAFLLFQIELIITKVILPTHGGGYLVWGACVVFFQAALLGGYVFAHGMIRKFGVTRYRFIHGLVSCIPLAFFPGRPLAIDSTLNSLPLVIDVFLQLLTSIGPVFFVLATISLVYQCWMAASELPQKDNPYALYAASNLGSFAALFSYPLFFEIFYDLVIQEWIWRIGYGLLLVLQFVVLSRLKLAEPPPPAATARPSDPRRAWHWFLFGAAPSMLFLAVTNIITIELAPFPLLWVIPLSIYLLSFVLNFKRRPWCPSWISGRFGWILAFALFLFFVTYNPQIPFPFLAVSHYLLLFLICMFCQRKLYLSKPETTEQLTLFYVIMAVGSFVGGFVVSWIIPLTSNTLIEFPLALLCIALALAVGRKERVPEGRKRRNFLVWGVLFLLLPLSNFLPLSLTTLAIVLILGYGFSKLVERPVALLVSFLVIVVFSSQWGPFDLISGKLIHRHRNYYGIYFVIDKGPVRYLVNGVTAHGGQYRSPDLQNKPILYYHPRGPVGQFFLSGQFPARRIAIVGLGMGGLTAYSQAGQSIDFFELDPDVHSLADRYFTCLKNSAAEIRVIYGDARLRLAQVPPGTYDLLIIDAFNGDAIPVHLLTTEALAHFRAKVRPEGIILFHISNLYLNLWPVIKTNAEEVKAYAYGSESSGNRAGYFYKSDWVALTWNADTAERLKILNWGDLSKNKVRYLRPWTDHYSNLLTIMNVRVFWKSIKSSALRLFSTKRR